MVISQQSMPIEGGKILCAPAPTGTQRRNNHGLPGFGATADIGLIAAAVDNTAYVDSPVVTVASEGGGGKLSDPADHPIIPAPIDGSRVRCRLRHEFRMPLHVA